MGKLPSNDTENKISPVVTTPQTSIDQPADQQASNQRFINKSSTRHQI